jgi:hypothetical protein
MRSGAFKLPCLIFVSQKSLRKNYQKERLCDVPGFGGEQKRNYMTVNLSLIVGHIRKLESAFSQGDSRARGSSGEGLVWRDCGAVLSVRQFD